MRKSKSDDDNDDGDDVVVVDVVVKYRPKREVARTRRSLADVVVEVVG